MVLNYFDGNKKKPSLGSYDPKLGFYSISNTFNVSVCKIFQINFVIKNKTSRALSNDTIFNRSASFEESTGLRKQE